MYIKPLDGFTKYVIPYADPLVGWHLTDDEPLKAHLILKADDIVNIQITGRE